MTANDIPERPLPLSERQRPNTALVAAARSGDACAVETLLDRYYPTMLRFLGRLSRNTDVAEDLTQEVMLTAALHIQQLTDDEAFVPWLHRIARNAFYSHQRRSWVRRVVSLDWLSVTPHGEHYLIDQTSNIDQLHDRDAIQQSLDHLSLPDRELMLLRHLVGCDGNEIAAIFGISRAAAYQRLHRAQGIFRRQYEELQADPSQLQEVTSNSSRGTPQPGPS